MDSPANFVPTLYYLLTDAERSGTDSEFITRSTSVGHLPKNLWVLYSGKFVQLQTIAMMFQTMECHTFRLTNVVRQDLGKKVEAYLVVFNPTPLDEYSTTFAGASPMRAFLAFDPLAALNSVAWSVFDLLPHIVIGEGGTLPPTSWQMLRASRKERSEVKEPNHSTAPDGEASLKDLFATGGGSRMYSREQSAVLGIRHNNDLLHELEAILSANSEVRPVTQSISAAVDTLEASNFDADGVNIEYHENIPCFVAAGVSDDASSQVMGLVVLSIIVRTYLNRGVTVPKWVLTMAQVRDFCQSDSLQRLLMKNVSVFDPTMVDAMSALRHQNDNLNYTIVEKPDYFITTDAAGSQVVVNLLPAHLLLRMERCVIDSLTSIVHTLSGSAMKGGLSSGIFPLLQPTSWVETFGWYAPSSMLSDPLLSHSLQAQVAGSSFLGAPIKVGNQRTMFSAFVATSRRYLWRSKKFAIASASSRKNFLDVEIMGLRGSATKQMQYDSLSGELTTVSPVAFHEYTVKGVKHAYSSIANVDESTLIPSSTKVLDDPVSELLTYLTRRKSHE
jgi:hypothetical protein